jgi:hypothetical protein
MKAISTSATYLNLLKFEKLIYNNTRKTSVTDIIRVRKWQLTIGINYIESV